MLLSHAVQSCTLVIKLTDMRYISDWAIKDLRLAYLTLAGALQVGLLPKIFSQHFN